MTLRLFVIFLLLFVSPPANAARVFVAASNDYVGIPNTANIGTLLSVSTWVKPASAGAAGANYYFSKGNNTGDVNWAFGYTGGVVRLVYTDSFVSFVVWSYTVTLTVGQWYHLAWTVDWTTNPDTVTVWIDGTQHAATCTLGSNNSLPTTTNPQTTAIGGYVGANFTFDGSLAEPAVFDGSLLGANEIGSLARGERADKVRFNVSSYFPLEGWQATEPDYGVNHLGSTTVTGTTRANGPPVIPR